VIRKRLVAEMLIRGNTDFGHSAFVASREAAKEYSPRREPWVLINAEVSPEGA